MTDYYTHFTNGLDTNAGTLAAPFKNPPKSPHATGTSAATTLVAGDKSYLASGEKWRVASFWDYLGGGASGTPVIWDAYGSGSLPIIDSRVALTGWTNYAGNIWQKTGLTTQINRVFFENLPQGKADNADSVTETKGFYYDAATDVLYIYSSANPDLSYSSIEVVDASVNFPIRVRDDSWVTFQNIDFRGGNQNTILIQNTAQGITIQDCTIGYGQAGGIFVQGEVATTIKDIIIKDNIINKRWNSNENNPALAPGGDGVSLQESVERGLINNNTIVDYGHSGVNITCVNATLPGVHNIIVEDNNLSAPKSNYFRGFDVAAGVNLATGNIIRRNKIHNTTVRNQIGGNGTQVYSNIIDGVSGTETQGGSAGEGIGLQTFLSAGTNTIVDACKVYNNTIINCKNNGIRLWTSNSIAMGTNEIVNNICTNNDTSIGLQLQLSADSGAIPTQVIDNNIFYHATASEVVKSRGVNYTVAAANAEADFANNSQSDPQIKVNYSLPSTSPGVGAGKYMTVHGDYNRVTVKNPPDIGAIQYFQPYSTTTRATTTRATTTRTIVDKRGMTG